MMAMYSKVINFLLKSFMLFAGSLDEFLPKALLDAAQVLLTSIGVIIVTVLVNPIVLVPLAILFVFFVFIQRYYLKTSKNIKRLEGTTRSHAFVHLAATINGLSTVRAFGAQDALKNEFDQHQNLHTGAWYMFISCSQAFGFALDFLCMFFVTCVTFSFLVFETREFNGASGKAEECIINSERPYSYIIFLSILQLVWQLLNQWR
jgi:ATP-binding cassette subfamily C (CFTR/MRP) protein 4